MHLHPDSSGDAFFSQTGWVFISFIIQAAAGAFLTLWLAWNAGREALGVFNQLYAVFVVLGQFYVLGVNDSSIKHSAEHRDAPSELRALTRGAMCSGLITGAAGFLLTLVLAQPIGVLVNSHHLSEGLLYLSPALWLFVFNKILTGLANGTQRMRLLAASQGLRAIVLVTVVTTLSAVDQPLAWFALAFLVAEVAVMMVFLPVIAEAFDGAVAPGSMGRWLRLHIGFGVRALPHGMLSETFLRVDILVLAVFISDADVGLYSFIAFFVEGVFQIPYVVRMVTTPRLVAVMKDRDWPGFVNQLRRSVPTSFLLTALAGGLVVLFFPWFQSWFPLLEDSRSPLLLQILVGGLIIYSVMGPFESLPLAAGRPVTQSVFMTLVVAINVVLNLVLIPTYGLTGAAFATAISFCASAMLLSGMMIILFRIPAWRSVRR